MQSLLFSFGGRINRAKFWLAHIAATVVLGIIAGIVVAATGGMSEAGPGVGAIIVLAVLYIALLWISLALSVKRCHDRNRSGWFVLVGMVPVLNIWYLIEVGFLRGTAGANPYGPDPIAAAA